MTCAIEMVCDMPSQVVGYAVLGPQQRVPASVLRSEPEANVGPSNLCSASPPSPAEDRCVIIYSIVFADTSLFRTVHFKIYQ